MGAVCPRLTVKPILLLSLPRSGSTLVQRVLATHPDVATVSEPWLLLPLTYSVRPEGARAEYWHPLAAQAVGDFAQALPGGRDEYLAEVGGLATRLYERLADGAEYFVDKTPRYHLIAEDLPRLLPDAKLIFLWRNPLAVVSSLLRTFRAGRFEPGLFSVDLESGLVNLTNAWEQAEDTGSAFAVRYEDLISGEREWRRLFEGLGLDFDPSLLEQFPEVELQGRYGDPTGVSEYETISAEPKSKWLQDLGGPVRKAWARAYLERIGEARLRMMGYDPVDLRAAIERTPRRIPSAPVDAMRLATSRLTDARHRRTVRRPDSPRPIEPRGRRRP